MIQIAKYCCSRATGNHGFVPLLYVFDFPHLYSRSCLTKLKAISPSTAPEDFGPLVECIVSWGRGADILELAADWLGAAFQIKHDETIEDEVGILVISSNKTMQYGVKRKATIRLPFNLHGKADSCLVFIQYCRPI